MSRPHSSESIWRAMADPKRRRIVELLRAGELTPGELVQEFACRGSTLSFHLRVLQMAGVITNRPREKGIVYSLNAAVLDQISRWTDHVRYNRRSHAKSSSPS